MCNFFEIAGDILSKYNEVALSSFTGKKADFGGAHLRYALVSRPMPCSHLSRLDRDLYWLPKVSMLLNVQNGHAAYLAAVTCIKTL